MIISLGHPFSPLFDKSLVLWMDINPFMDANIIFWQSYDLSFMWHLKIQTYMYVAFLYV